MGGVARAAQNTGAIVLDSGINSCIEKFCARRGVRLVGVCPEAEITYPKLTDLHRKANELTSGHTHFLIIGREEDKVKYEWGVESAIKFDFGKRITQGRPKALGAVSLPFQKMIAVVLGDNEPQAIRDIEVALNHGIPIVVVGGSPFCDDVINQMKNNEREQTEKDQPV